MIKLVKPDKSYETDVFAYKQEMIEAGDPELNGCGGLDKQTDFDSWYNRILEYVDRNTIPKDSPYVEGSQWFLVNTETNRILGMVNIRHYLNDHLSKFGGHIGYSIRPSERRMGYGKLQLKLALDFLKTKGVEKALLSCDDNNPASYKTIEACGGVLENKIIDEEYGLVRRYWISLK